MKASRYVMLGAILGMLTGCEIKPPSQLTKPPQASESMQEIMAAVNQFIPSGAKLTIPSQSEERSAISLLDVDGDGSNEIVTFYQKNSTSADQNGLLVLKQTAGKWSKLADIKGLATDVAVAKFPDVTGDSHPDIVVGWSYGEGMDGEVAVYSWQAGQMKQIWSHPNTLVGIGDVNGDNKADVTIVEHDHNEMTARALLYSYVDAQMKEIDQVKLDGSVGAFTQVLVGKATPDKQGVFIDASVGAHSAITSLLIMENGHLKDVLLDKDQQSTTFKAYPLDSKDVNHDGIIEIGLQTQPVGTEDMAMVEIPWISSWYQWDPSNQLKLVQESYADYDVGFDFTIPQKWWGKYTVIRKYDDQDQKTIQFVYLADGVKHEINLVTLYAVKRSNWQAMQSSHPRAVVLGENNGRMILAELPTETPELPPAQKGVYQELQLDEAQVREALSIFHL